MVVMVVIAVMLMVVVVMIALVLTASCLWRLLLPAGDHRRGTTFQGG
jgi:hypothetical protein